MLPFLSQEIPMMKIRTLLLAAFAACLSIGAAAADPATITLLQGFAPGGNADTIGRIVAQGLSRELGQSVIVDAKTGAGGNIASAAVAQAKPDGHTLILLTGGHAVSAAMYKSLTFDPLDGFVWLTMVTRFPFVIATGSDSRFHTLAEVVAQAKAAPGTLSFSSVGIGSTQHLSGELFQSLAGVQLNHMPYRGGGAPVQDVIAGRVDLLFDTVTVARAQIEGGRLRALGVTSPEPSPLLPGVAPVAQVVPGYAVGSWSAVAAPKGLPPEVAARLFTALQRVLRSPEVIKQLEATGGIVTPSASSQEVHDYVGTQIAKWKKVVHDAHIPQH
jgi:tripartite-type tricarboxylate transporter receptor subunit TctC